MCYPLHAVFLTIKTKPSHTGMTTSPTPQLLTPFISNQIEEHLSDCTAALQPYCLVQGHHVPLRSGGALMCKVMEKCSYSQ